MLAYRKAVDLMWHIFSDLEELKASYPNVTTSLFGASWMERRVWRDCRCPIAINRARKAWHWAVVRRVAALGGSGIEGPPSAMVIQLSENDLAYRKGVDLIWNIINDLELLRASHENITIIWSSLLERRCWKGMQKNPWL